MYIIAILGDLFSMVPFLNIATDALTAAALGMTSAGTRLSLFSDRNIGGTLATILVEAIPGVSFLPTWTLRVFLLKRSAAQSEEDGEEEYAPSGGGDDSSDQAY